MKLVIVDYGMGNIKSIISAFKYNNLTNIVVSNDYNEIKFADKLLLPGVGSFARAIENIKELEIDKYLHEIVLVDKKPILGICLGMQILSSSSEEDGFSHGLNYVDAKCEKFKLDDLKIPHVGFNQVNINKKSKLLGNLENGSDFYFTHSYCLGSNSDICQSNCNYGNDFVAAYEVDNIAGVQFHPELSQTNGLKLLKNFIEKF